MRPFRYTNTPSRVDPAPTGQSSLSKGCRKVATGNEVKVRTSLVFWKLNWRCVPSDGSGCSMVPLHLRARTPTALVRFCSDIPLSAKFRLSDFLRVKDYRNHVLESPPPRRHPLGASVVWSQDIKWPPPAPHVRDPELFWEITSPGCTAGSHCGRFWWLWFPRRMFLKIRPRLSLLLQVELWLRNKAA